MIRNGISIKLLSVLLALFMLTAVIPFGVLNVNAKIIDSGKCGEKITWQFDDEGTLTLSGEGAMYEYNSYEEPWYEDEDGNGGFSSEILKVVVKGKITKICGQAFQDLCNLKTAVIGDSVEELGNGVFLGCDRLDDITLPDKPLLIGSDLLLDTAYERNADNWKNGLLYFGNYLLMAKDDLSGSCTIKDGTLSIAASAFRYCESLTEINIPESVKIMGENVFYGCLGITGIKLPSGLKAIPGAAFAQCRGLKSINIPYGVENIYGHAFFACDALSLVTIPDTVKYIDWNAFYCCLSLKSLTVRKNVTEIGEHAFGFTYEAGDAKKLDDFTLYCYKDSAADKYAKENGLKTVYLELSLLPGFKPGNKIEDIGKRFPKFKDAILRDKKGDMITSGSLFTGLKVIPMKGLVNVEYEVVVTGDTDGNGKIDSTDYITVKRHILKISELFGAYEEAADTDGNGKIDSTDYIAIKRHILGIAEL